MIFVGRDELREAKVRMDVCVCVESVSTCVCAYLLYMCVLVCNKTKGDGWRGKAEGGMEGHGWLARY